MIRISIDPNVRTVSNHTRTGFEDVFGDVDDLEIGNTVLAMVLETNIVFDAKVTSISHWARLVYLEVDWSSVREDS